MQASAPSAKDIVIVMDNVNGASLSVIKEAVKILLGTTNPNDRVSAIKGGVDGGSPCRMSIIRNGNVALSNLRKAPVTLSILRKAPVALLILRKAPVALSNLRKAPVACH